MLVNDVSASVQPAETRNSTVGLAENFDNFLRLLTTQMSHQDPLEPLDATEFTSQLAQFTGVEQAVNMNKKLGELIQVQRTGQAAAAVSYLGTLIEARGETARLEEGRAQWSYTLLDGAERTTITIRNAEGRAVRTLAGATGAGTHTLVWDGRGDGGDVQPAGAYTIEVDARDATDKRVAAETNFVGRVDGVSFTGEQVMLSVGGAEVALENVLSVKEPPVAPAVEEPAAEEPPGPATLVEEPQA